MSALLPAGLRAEIETFEAGNIEAGTFDHEAHVRVAWGLLRLHGTFDASARYSAALQRITARLGVPEKYHATITGFFMLLIAERVARDPDADWQEFRQRNADLCASPGDLLKSHYSDSRLKSPLARRLFLLPDAAGRAQGAATI